MDQVKDGGPAFPQEALSISRKDGRLYEAHGMTLLDYFAAKAMQACIVGQGVPDFHGSRDGIAEAAYKMADAMIKAREANHG